MNTAALVPLSDLQQQKLIELLTYGYTARYITRYFLTEYKITLTDSDVLRAAVQFGAAIDQYQEEIGKQVLNHGLSQRAERVRRLSVLAEKLEPNEGAKVLELKTVKVYLQTLKQIHDETEPFEILKAMDPDDPWVKLLSDLSQLPSKSVTS